MAFIAFIDLLLHILTVTAWQSLKTLRTEKVLLLNNTYANH